MARKARQWENWENWTAAKQEEMRINRQRWTEDKARSDEEWRKGLHKVFGGGGREAQTTGWVQDISGGWFEVAIQPERPAAMMDTKKMEGGSQASQRVHRQESWTWRKGELNKILKNGVDYSRTWSI